MITAALARKLSMIKREQSMQDIMSKITNTIIEDITLMERRETHYELHSTDRGLISNIVTQLRENGFNTDFTVSDDGYTDFTIKW